MPAGAAMRVVIAGAGIFGITAALELRARGHRVTVLDAGAPRQGAFAPDPRAASSDISKVVRLAYGADADYLQLMEQALAGWRRWSAGWQTAGSGSLYHETGVLMMTRSPMQAGGFEYESWRLLRQRGHRPRRITAATLAQRHPAWSNGRYVDGFFHAAGGYAESGRVVAALAAAAVRRGVRRLPGRQAADVESRTGDLNAVRTLDGELLPADAVVIAAGAWSARLVPALATALRLTGHAVFHLRPRDPELFAAPHFPVFTADIARTGYYGFPLTPDGVVKVGNHGPGRPIDPDAPRAVTARDEDKLREFLADSLPALQDAPIVHRRLCLYCDTSDGDFWIGGDPVRRGVTVAGGGSGHAFKFAPVLGPLIADAVEGRANPLLLGKFRWRAEVKPGLTREAARHVAPHPSGS